MSGQGEAGNVIAALCNVFIPGLGHLVQGRVVPAAAIFIAVSIGYWLWFLVIPPVAAAIIHLAAIYSAATYKPNDYFSHQEYRDE